MKKQDKVSKKKEAKKDNKLSYSVDNIRMTLKKGDKYRMMWVSGSEVREWNQKYYSWRKTAKWAAIGISIFFGVMEPEKYKEAIAKKDKIALWDAVMDDATGGILLFYLIMIIFFKKSMADMNAAMKKKF